MNKGTKIAIAVVGILSIVSCGGVWFYYSSALDRLDEAKAEAAQAGEKMTLLLAGSWDYAAIELSTSLELLETYTEEELIAKLGRHNEELGELISAEGDVTSFDMKILANDQAKLFAEYTAIGTFEKGEATLVLKLSRDPRNDWKLAGFTVKQQSSDQRSSE